MRSLSSDAACVLDNMSAERFALLQRCLRAQQPFTASQVASVQQTNARAAARDLAALERMDLIRGVPSPETKRQGRRIYYTASGEKASAIFREIAEAAVTSLRAWKSVS